MTPAHASNLDRRPLKSRQWGVMQRAAVALAARRVRPNAISVAGLIAGILGGVCLAATGWAPPAAYDWPVRGLALGAAACIQFRLLCNLLDGLVAVEGDMRSAVGEIYNEVPDRLSDAATLIGAGYGVLSSPTLGYVAATVALLVAYIRAVGKGCGLAYDFCGPMAKPQRMAVMAGACVVVAVVPRAGADLAWGGEDAAWGPLAWGLVIVVAGGGVTAIRRLVRLSRALRGRGG